MKRHAPFLGSLKLFVSPAKEPYKRDCILQKRPVILRSLLIAATPYMKRHAPAFGGHKGSVGDGRGIFFLVTCHTCGWVMSHVCVSLLSYTWIRHINMNGSCHTHTGSDFGGGRECSAGGVGGRCLSVQTLAPSLTWMTHSYVRHDSCIVVTWLMNMCVILDVARSYVWHGGVGGRCLGVQTLLPAHTWRTHSNVRHDSFLCVISLIHMCCMFDVTCSYVG